MITITYPIKIADLYDLAIQYGFRIERVTLEDCDQLTAHIDANGLEIEFKERKQMGRKRQKLGDILQKMYVGAANKPGEVMRSNLPGGLRIDMLVGIDGQTRIMLARKGVFPSATEWAVVLGHLPVEPSLDIVPERFEHMEWRCLRAAWDTPVEK